MNEKDGGPAFPVPPGTMTSGGDIWYPCDGMSLRDWFAGQALMAMIGKIPLLKDRDQRNIVPSAELVSEAVGIEIRTAACAIAYDYADRMLESRNR